MRPCIWISVLIEIAKPPPPPLSISNPILILVHNLAAWFDRDAPLDGAADITIDEFAAALAGVVQLLERLNRLKAANLGPIPSQ